MSRNDREVIAKRIAMHLSDEDVVNLGVGIPTLVSKYVEDKTIYFQTENGLLGMGPQLEKTAEGVDVDLIDAGKFPISATIEASYFDSAFSFGMIRGGHVDVAVLGILQIDQYGEIANWAVPGQPILGVGGAMDLVVGAKKVIAASLLFTKDGQSKLMKSLTFETSGTRRVDLYVTEYAEFSFKDGRVIVESLYGDLTFDELQEKMEVPLTMANIENERVP